jgi:hypothetical protein
MLVVVGRAVRVMRGGSPNIQWNHGEGLISGVVAVKSRRPAVTPWRTALRPYQLLHSS